MGIREPSDIEKEEIIQKTYNFIERLGMELPAILFLESVKPLLWVGGATARIFLGPFMLAFWDNGFVYINTFEEMQNIEKLIKMIEDKHKKEREKSQQDNDGGEKHSIMDSIKKFLGNIFN
jgi:hypothetical protein